METVKEVKTSIDKDKAVIDALNRQLAPKSSIIGAINRELDDIACDIPHLDGLGGREHVLDNPLARIEEDALRLLKLVQGMRSILEENTRS